jgi:hypothetical protein
MVGHLNSTGFKVCFQMGQLVQPHPGHGIGAQPITLVLLEPRHLLAHVLELGLLRAAVKRYKLSLKKQTLKPGDHI